MRCATVRLCAKAASLSSGMGMFLAQPLLEHLMVGRGEVSVRPPALMVYGGMCPFSQDQSVRLPP